MDYYRRLQQNFLEIIEQHQWGHELIHVTVQTLTPEEAIGAPEHNDYPLVKGRERMMEAQFKGALGQAFTDMYGAYRGTLIDTVRMELKDNYRRTVFLATLNAVTRHLGTVEKTVHCKDESPPICAKELASYIRKTLGKPRIAMVGLQPRMVQALSTDFDLRVVDMDDDNIGQEKFGVRIGGPDKTVENLSWCDLALVTGTVFTNASLQDLLEKKTTIFYGVTVSGAAKILNLDRFCPLGM